MMDEVSMQVFCKMIELLMKKYGGNKRYSRRHPDSVLLHDSPMTDPATSLDPNQSTIDTNDQNPAQQKHKKCHC